MSSPKASKNKAEPHLIITDEIANAIIASLKKCPHFSCTKKSLTSRVLKHLNKITRGKPRKRFERRVKLSLRKLVDEGLVEEYKAKNERVRLCIK